jgi:hypothetical protein
MRSIRRRRSPREVWFGRAMGLLDDAIREHLEFKRLRGADPGEVAREEHEALGPVHRGQEPQPEGAEVHSSGEDPRGEERPIEAFPPGSGSFVPTGQETAELDMRAVLRTEHPDEDPVEDSLEWEVPGEASEEPHEPTPSGELAGGDGDRAEAVEDVLEETPDFLRETPDQERLWFEQQPPRDFDFDK